MSRAEMAVTGGPPAFARPMASRPPGRGEKRPAVHPRQQGRGDTNRAFRTDANL